MSSPDFCAALLDQAGRFAASARGVDPASRVPSCPDWDVAELVVHVGRAYRWAGDLVGRTVTDPTQMADTAAFTPPDGLDARLDWLLEAADQLVAAVRRVGSDTPVWNFTGRESPVAAFWPRRMTHDTVVHRVDLALAVNGSFDVDPELAADTISEFLDLVTAPGAAAARPDLAAEMRGTGQIIHLHATDSPSLGEAGEWVITRGPEAVTWGHGHTKGDVAARAKVTDLMRMLFNRTNPGDPTIEVFGDAELLGHWCRNVTF
ncbi:maleylpyruvate isomerase N-terminal domain-containing protein [Pseudonocardia spinosispora]|uniref:maleylpyruvate isomerase N-terminal domain-containing protein n=1 Tax=Pseudonocardia spinosispora TaxID=103441 RepID=UPI00041296E3|nr:maleylpyruvate isomerase N-terminal domain-containing protein [Pseudonocardia spinosispora]